MTSLSFEKTYSEKEFVFQFDFSTPANTSAVQKQNHTPWKTDRYGLSQFFENEIPKLLCDGSLSKHWNTLLHIKYDWSRIRTGKQLSELDDIDCLGIFNRLGYLFERHEQWSHQFKKYITDCSLNTKDDFVQLTKNGDVEAVRDFVLTHLLDVNAFESVELLLPSNHIFTSGTEVPLFIIACITNNVAMLHLFIRAGARLNISGGGLPFLYRACFVTDQSHTSLVNSETLKILIDNGLDIHNPHPVVGRDERRFYRTKRKNGKVREIDPIIKTVTALGFACQNMAKNHVITLIHSGASVSPEEKKNNFSKLTMLDQKLAISFWKALNVRNDILQELNQALNILPFPNEIKFIVFQYRYPNTAELRNECEMLAKKNSLPEISEYQDDPVFQHRCFTERELAARMHIVFLKHIEFHNIITCLRNFLSVQERLNPLGLCLEYCFPNVEEFELLCKKFEAYTSPLDFEIFRSNLSYWLKHNNEKIKWLVQHFLIDQWQPCALIKNDAYWYRISVETEDPISVEYILKDGHAVLNPHYTIKEHDVLCSNADDWMSQTNRLLMFKHSIKPYLSTNSTIQVKIFSIMISYLL